MTPEEGRLVTELFDRLATLEDAQRDPQAERLIKDGLRQAPNAPYALVQTVLVQDEALKRADARIRELEGSGQRREEDSSFLGTMRDAFFGGEKRGSVPTVRPGTTERGMSSAWRTTGAQPAAPLMPGAAVPPGSGGSFLGTAAAAAAGVIGGSLLLDGIRSMMGHPGGAHAAFDAGTASGSPWGGSAADSHLAREAGLDDIGRTGGAEHSSGSYGLVGDDTDADDTDALQSGEDVGDFDDLGSGGDDLTDA